jgi:ketosteroid isomerase-like protein
MSDITAEATIRAWERAIRKGDMAGILARHPEDILMYDVNGPLEWRGLSDYRKTWEYFFSFGDPADDLFVIEQLEVTEGADVAFATGLLRIGGSAEPICRLTLGLRRQDGRWVIAHEHHSSADPIEDK